MNIGEVRIINGRLSLITGGGYWGSGGGVSNFWYWKTIRQNGTLGKEYHGYNDGNTNVSRPIEHKIIIKVDTFDLLKVEQ